MKAMILAAGRGERMRPLTDHTPKPLLKAGGKPLIQWHIEKLVAAGLSEIVINTAWLGHKLEDALGDGRHLGAQIHWSHETPALEAAGGIARALPKLGPDPFLVVNGDVWTDWDFHEARRALALMEAKPVAARLLLVDNPAHNDKGDFTLDNSGRVHDRSEPGVSLTFSGIGIYHPSLFAEVSAHESAALAPLLRKAMREDLVLGHRHHGIWMDIGTPERLQQLDTELTM